MEKENQMNILEKIDNCLNDSNWQDKVLNIINTYLPTLTEDDEIMTQILEKLKRYATSHNIFAVKQSVKIELNNIRGITEKKCKLAHSKNGWCSYCKNLNCNLNQNRGGVNNG